MAPHLSAVRLGLRASMCLVIFAGVSCGSADGNGSDRSPEEQRLRSASQGLCAAVELAGEGDVDAAEDAFTSKVHAFLHEFADRLSESDRAATAELLEAKQRVEAAFADPAASPSEVSGALAALKGELDAAAASSGLAAAPCQEGSP